MSDASKRGRNARRKGAGFERKVAEMWNEEFGTNVKRRLDGPRGHCEDLVGTGPFSVECKHYASIGRVYEWVDQAAANAPIGKLPIVIAQADGRKPLVIMPWPVAARLIRGELGGDDGRGLDATHPSDDGESGALRAGAPLAGTVGRGVAADLAGDGTSRSSDVLR